MAENAIETEEDGTAYTPTFSVGVRKAVYIVGVIVGFVSVVVVGSAAAIGWPQYVETVAGLIGTGFASVAAGFGVAYAGK